MRVLALRGENLASLTGLFEVDFQAPPLADAGLFAVTGPTGAGKSTLLDALCLALFDAVPRLANSSSALVGAEAEPEDRRLPANDVRSVLTRGAGRGFAEVDFAGNDGRRYRARWEVRRARERADGRYQAQTLSLFDLQENRPLGRVKGEVQALIVERLGLTFDQFRRAVLLAQGDFAAFLRAKERERSELLERITGTELYGQVSRAAHERAGAEAHALRELEARLSGIRALPPEERVALGAETRRLRGVLDGAEQGLAGTRAAAAWCQAQATLEAAAANAESRLTGAAGALADASPRQQALRQAERAEPLRAPVDRADQACAEHEAAVARLTEARSGETRAAAEVAGSEARVAARASEAQAAEQVRQAMRPEIEAARRLDTRLTECEQRLARAGATARDAAAAGERAQAARAALEQEHARGVLRREQEQGWLQAHAALAPLARGWAHWDAEIGRYGERLGAARAAEARLVALDARHRQAQADAREGARARAATALTLATARDSLAAAEAACAGPDLAILQAQERGLVERLLAVAGRSSEALRAGLVPGEPCPVCGSRDHPWLAVAAAAAQPAAPLGAEPAGTLDGRRRSLEGEVEAARTALAAALAARSRRDGAARSAEAAREADDAARQRVVDAEARLQGIDRERALEAQTAQSARAELEAIRRALAAPLAPLEGWEAGLAADPSAFRADSGARVREWLGHEAALTAAEAGLTAVAPRLAEAQATARAAGETAARAAAEVEGAAGERAGIAAERGGLLRGQAADEVETGLQGRLDAAATAWRHAEAGLSAAASALAVARALAERHAGEASVRELACVEARRLRDSALAAQSLDLAEVRQLLARDPGWVERERRALEALVREERDARVLAEERRRQAAEHGATRPPGLDCATVAAGLAGAEAAHGEAQAAWAGAQGRMQEDERRRQEAAGLEAEVATRASGARLWEELRDLIGSADGNKFRTFAQSLTLDALLAHANRHLEDLARRYRLAR
ncbi:MAG: AAA family ATPase, partial [Gammaproteobacteria bacterium]|nr:AAA family ATPase [Gammaproteobacteria bacterium]